MRESIWKESFTERAVYTISQCRVGRRSLVWRLRRKLAVVQRGVLKGRSRSQKDTVMREISLQA
jgi:hypothetical protein